MDMDGKQCNGVQKKLSEPGRKTQETENRGRKANQG